MLSIITPVFNGAKTIKPLYKKTKEIMNQNNISFEMILIDDGSFDDSVAVIRQMCHQYKEVKGIILRENAGQQNALLAGIRQAKGEMIITMDDDLQTNPKDIVLLLTELDKGYDVVYGVPVEARQVAWRKIGTSIKEWLFFLFLKKPFNIKLTSFRGMNQRVIDYVKEDPFKEVYISARLLQFTRHICNVPITHYRRVLGKSNYNWQKLYNLLIRTLINYSKLCPRRFKKIGKQYDISEILDEIS